MQIHTLKDIDSVAKAVAEALILCVSNTLQQRDYFSIVLSGGSTPKKLYELLATEEYKNKIDWNKLYIFWGDERFVPFNNERNNAKMAFDTLLNHVPVNREQVYIMQTGNITPEDSTKEYNNLVNHYLENKGVFDFVLLGMGDDGHTLSLFPGNEETIFEEKNQCISLWLPAQNMHRITLTYPPVNNAREIVFMVTGDNKSKVLKQVLQGDYNPLKYPSQIIKPGNGELHWFIDEDAASLLK